MENPQGVENREVPKSPVRPIVEYDPRLNREEVPYTININVEKCVSLMRELGLSDDKIKKLKIKLSTKSRRSLRVGRLSISTLGMYNLVDNSLSVYGDPFWQQYQERLRKKENSDLGRGQEGSLAGFLYTESISREVNRGLVGVFLHESKHLSDSDNLKKKILRITLGLGTLGGIGGIGLAVSSILPVEPLSKILGLSISSFAAPIYYITDPYEKRARSFEANNRNDPRWQNLLTISPKQK